jgi:hypothetical protein
MRNHDYKVPVSARVAAAILPDIVFKAIRRAGARLSR